MSGSWSSRLLPLVLLAALVLAPSASAGERTAVAYGHLWVTDASGDLVQVSPTGQRTVFDVPGGRVAEALTVDRAAGSGRLWLTARNANGSVVDPAAGGPVVLLSVTADGQFSAPADLGFTFSPDTYYPLRDLTVSADGDVWVARGWSPCDPGSGDVYRYRPSTGQTTRIVPPANKNGTPAYVNSRVVADRFGRVFASLARDVTAAYDKCTGPGTRVFQHAFEDGAFFTLDGAAHGGFYDLMNEPVPCAGGLGSSPFVADVAGTVWCASVRDAVRFDAEYLNWWNYQLGQTPGVFMEQAFGTAGTDGFWVRWYRTVNGAASEFHIGRWTADGTLRTFPELDDVVSFPIPDDPGFAIRTDFEIAPDGTYWVLLPKQDGSFDVLRTGKLGAGQELAKVEPFNRDMFFSCWKCPPPSTNPGPYVPPTFPGEWQPSTTTSTGATKTRVSVSQVKLTRRSLTVRASAAVTFKARVQQRRGRTWSTVRTVTVKARAGKATTVKVRTLRAGRYRVRLTAGTTTITRTVRAR